MSSRWGLLSGWWRRAATSPGSAVFVAQPTRKHSHGASGGLVVATVTSPSPRIAPLVVLEGCDLPPELHCSLTPVQARGLAIRLLQAAATCEEVAESRAALF